MLHTGVSLVPGWPWLLRGAGLHASLYDGSSGRETFDV